MEVKAIRRGYYGQQRDPGAQFTLTDKKHFSKAWMVEVKPERAEKPEKPDKGTKAE